MQRCISSWTSLVHQDQNDEMTRIGGEVIWRLELKMMVLSLGLSAVELRWKTALMKVDHEGFAMRIEEIEAQSE